MEEELADDGELADNGDLYEAEEEPEEEEEDEEYLDDASASDGFEGGVSRPRAEGTRRQPARRAAAALPALRPRRGDRNRARRDRNVALPAPREQGSDEGRALRTRQRGARLLARAAPGLGLGSGSGRGGRPASAYAWLQGSEHTPGVYVPQVRRPAPVGRCAVWLQRCAFCSAWKMPPQLRIANCGLLALKLASLRARRRCMQAVA